MRAPPREDVMRETCTFRYDHDPATRAPKGRRCRAAAVEVIYWKDGRNSVACRNHGVDALTPEARAEILSTKRLET